MSDELKPCPFNIGDKVRVNTDSQVFVGYVTGIDWDASRECWMFAVSRSLSIEGIPKLGMHFYFDEIELIERPLCPETLEAAAKAICLSENDELCIDAPCIQCSFHAKAALESSSTNTQLKR